MQLFDPNEMMEDNLDDENVAEANERARKAHEERERKEREAEQARKEQLEKDCSELDKARQDKIKNDLAAKLNKLHKELGKDLEASQDNQNQNADGDGDGADDGGVAAEALTYAIYDKDAGTRENQMVKKIDKSDKLDEDERNRLLAGHQAGLGEIDKLMDDERKRQEQDLDAMLRARLDRRRKRAKDQNGD